MEIDVRRTAPNCTVNVWAAVSGAPHLQVLRSTLAPDELNVTFLYNFDGEYWGLWLYVNGTRILRDGSRGRSRMTATFHEDNIDNAPEWIRDFVRAHTPPLLPQSMKVSD